MSMQDSTSITAQKIAIIAFTKFLGIPLKQQLVFVSQTMMSVTAKFYFLQPFYI